MIDAAMEKLQKEIDLKEIIKFLRVNHLIQKIVLSKRQRWSVPYFRRYTINEKQAKRILQKDKKRQNQTREEDDENESSNHAPVEIPLERILKEL